MAKRRFRDLKQGKIKEPKYNKKAKKSNYNFARRGDVFKAILTDSFMLWMPVLYIVFYVVFGSREGFAEHKMLGWIYVLSSIALLEIAFLLESGQTPGMRAYSLKLIFMPTSQKPPATTIILRQLLSKITFILFGWITLFFRKDGRNLHDLITGTALVYDKAKN
jgi:uncharacterized RDD family membrane protein YckC